MTRTKHWEILWLVYDRTGFVETLKLFGFTIYRRSGSVVELFGYHWIEKK